MGYLSAAPASKGGRYMRAADFIGQRFGKLTVIEDSGQRNGTSVLWHCKCDCGGEIFAVRGHLVRGIVQDCGCVKKEKRPAVTDLIGQRFGKLIVVGDSGERKGGGSILWRCKCDCGGEILAVRNRLISGNVTSCGCVPKQYASKREVEDLTGRQFGELTAIRRVENDKGNKVCWLCRCSCGKELVVQALRLKSGHTRSCGCKRYGSAYNKRDLTGQQFGRLTVLYRLVGKTRYQKAIWHCRCDCGNEVDVYSGSLVRGQTQSCGCWNREQSAKMHDHMHYQDDTCVERLERALADHEERKSKAGFRGLFFTKYGTYRVMITFQKVHYTLGYYKTFGEAVQARLDAEESLHTGYIAAFKAYQEKAKDNPAWAEENPFFYNVSRVNKEFLVNTNG